MEQPTSDGAGPADRVRRDLSAAALRHRDVHARSRRRHDGRRARSVRPMVGRGDRRRRRSTSIRPRSSTRSARGRRATTRAPPSSSTTSDVRWVSLQHEYGIFGGDDGAYILDFLERPARAGDRHPAHRARAARRTRSGRSCSRWPRRARLVVMSQVAADLLARSLRRARRAASTSSRTGFPTWRRAIRTTLKARFGVAGQRMLLTFGLLGPEQGHRDGDPRAAGGDRRLSRSRLLRRRRDPPGRPAPARRGLPHDARARGRAARRARPRGVSRPVRHHRGAVQLPAGDRRLRQPLPQRGAGDERRALVRDGRGRRGRLDAVLARAGAAGRRARPPVPVRRQRRAGRDASSRCSSSPGGARPGAAPRRYEFTRAIHLAARRRAATSSSARRCSAARAGAPRRAEAAAREQPARAAPRSSAAHDRRHRHHPARDLQRAGARQRLLRRRQRARADRRAARRSAEQLAARPSGWSSTYLAFLHAAQTARRTVQELHELRAASFDRRRRRRRTARAARSGRWASTVQPGGRRGAAHAGARRCSSAALPARDELGPRGTRADACWGSRAS